MCEQTKKNGYNSQVELLGAVPLWGVYTHHYDIITVATFYTAEHGAITTYNLLPQQILCLDNVI